MNSIVITENVHVGHPARAVSIFVACAFFILLFSMFCGVAGAVDYGAGSGIETITSVNCGDWSTTLSNSANSVSTNIVIQNGAVLNLNAATISMRQITIDSGGVLNLLGNTIVTMESYDILVSGTLDVSDSTIKVRSGKSINVYDGATMNVRDGSTITHYSSYYYFKYWSGSFGYIDGSKIEYSYKLQIDTPNFNITNSEIKLNNYEGISLTSNSENVNIINNTINNNGVGGTFAGIKIESSSNNNNLSYNTIQSNDIGIDISSGSNTLLDNTISSNVREGIIVASNSNTINNNTITNNGDTGDYAGIKIDNSYGNNLSDNTIEDDVIGVSIVSSGSNTLRDNNINGTLRSLYVTVNYDNYIDTSNRVNGGVVYYKNSIDGVSIVGDDNVGHIMLNNCSNVLVKGNTFVTNGDGISLLSSSDTNITIDNNVLSSSNYNGIYLWYSRANITNNTVTDSDISAISLNSHNNINVTNNTVSGNGADAAGIELSSSSYNNLTNNTVTGNGADADGISLSLSSYNDLIDNILTNNLYGNGITLISSSNNNLINNSLNNNGDAGLSLSSSNSNTIINNDIINNDVGITILSLSSNNNISNNNISFNDGTVGNGVEISSSSGNDINNNVISSNDPNGILMVYGGPNNFSNNVLDSNAVNGIYIQASGSTYSNNTITGTGTGYGFYIDFGQYDNFIYQNNTVNGEKIYYYYNNNVMQTDPVSLTLTNTKVSNVGKISLIKCSNIEIKDNVLSGNAYANGGVPSGIFLYESTENIISNNSIANNNRGIYLYDSSNNIINNSNSINTSEDRGIYFNISDYNEIINNIVGLNTITGIYFNFSDNNNITGNDITGNPEGILFDTSLYNNLSTNNISNYTLSAIRLIEYSHNNTMIGNTRSIRNSADFDIHINDSNNTIIASNQATAANYSFYLTGDTRVITLDSLFNKTKVGFEDTSNLTLMWRMDAFSWDTKHLEPIWGNLSVRYGDYSDAGDILLWEGEVSDASGRLSNNPKLYWGPPTRDENWLPIIEYKQNATGKIDYSYITPLNVTVVNRWDVLQGIDKSYQNITATVHGPGVTIIVNAGYTPNGRCYYCHMDKLTYRDMRHWTQYSIALGSGTIGAYTPPGRCIDCHDYNDSITIPHGHSAGNEMLHQQNPQLCYNGNGSQVCHNADSPNATHKQEVEFNQTTHHNLSEGKMTCFSCHNNHGTDNIHDLHKYYKPSAASGCWGGGGTYNSANYELCFVCHLEEKLRASPTLTGGYLFNFKNQTNFRDDYYNYNYQGFNYTSDTEPRTPNPTNLHIGPHRSYTCSYCHNPHGSNNPANTRPGLNWTYITNLIAPGNITYPFGDWANYSVLDQANWSNSTLNQGAGFGVGGRNKCTWHSTSTKRIPNMFVYREYVDYESAGGPDCVGCHDSSDPNAIRRILNVTALKLAMHANLSLDFRNGGDLQGTGMNWTEWGDARGYNASNISTDNAICWSCHSTNGTPPYPGFHPDRAMAPYKCPTCHGPLSGQPPHTSGLVVAIDNHGPTTKGAGSVYIQTSVGNNGSCPDCHAPSKLPNSSIGTLQVWRGKSGATTNDFVTYTGRTTNGDVSHYGLNRQQGEALGIENPLVNTSNCLYCHTNSTNGAIWGNAMNISGNMYGADTTNVSECYTYCHVLPDYVGIINETNIPYFHNKSVFAGGGPNCVDCHDTNSTYHVQSLVNTTSVAQGIHGNMGNNTIELISGIDPRSKPCWGCHQSNGHEPEGMGDRNGIYDQAKKPWTCEDCHGRSSEWVAATEGGQSWLSISHPPNPLPPIVYAHYPNSSTVKTNVSGLGRCVDCHNNSIDPYRNDTASMRLGNTIFSNVSHYGVNRSQGVLLGLANPLFDTSDCGVCHNSTENGTIWGGAIQNEHGNFTNYSAEDGCYTCHTTDDQTPANLHVENVSAGLGGPDCLVCHGGTGSNRIINSTIFNDSVHINLNSDAVNDTSLIYNSSKACWLCHGDGTEPDEHSSVSDLTTVRTCYDTTFCHGNTTLNKNVSVQEHFVNGIDIATSNGADDVSSCIDCHNLTEMKVTDAPTDKSGLNLVSHYAKNYTTISSLRNSVNSTTYCLACHNNTNSIFYNASIITTITDHGENCSSCHGAGRIHDETLSRPQTSGNCTDCHSQYGTNYSSTIYHVNVTAINMGVHANVNSNMNSTAEASPVNDINNSKCWGCHVIGGAYPENGHSDTINNGAYFCYDCHNGTAKAYANVSSAPAVYNHIKDGVNISARTVAATTSESCGYGCHNLTSMKVSGFEGVTQDYSYRQNLSQPSHYAKNRSDIYLEESNISDCMWCHKNSSNEFIDIFERSESNSTADISHAENLDSCILPVCHTGGRIHDQNLTKPTWVWNNECKNCHFGLVDSIYYMNETMFNASVHKTVNCTGCHTNEASSHPIAEYNWKWCECCHSYQTDPINQSDRHNVTRTPSTYSYSGTNVLEITDCTTCHDATVYNESVEYYNTSGNKCRYCHAYPNKGNMESQDWF